MLNRFAHVAFVLLFGVVLVGCRTAPVYNVTENQFTAPASSVDVATTAIKTAGAGLGWQMKEAGSGHIVGTLALRSHLAVVDINYDTKAYSIRYKDSTNLKYDGSNIHSNYNGWIQNLETAILAQSSTF